MSTDNEVKLTPDETIVQVTAAGNRLFALTSKGRILFVDSGRGALGWRELQLPETVAE